MIYVAVYLVAIVVANLLTAKLGPAITPITAFFLIGLDISVRDHLHERWSGKGLWAKMGLLILTGSFLSFLINRAAGAVAIASFLAFAVSSSVDAIVYHATNCLTRFERINWSNLISAAVDSVLFPTIAFGWPPSMEIVYGQAVAKIAGGLFWSLIIYRLLIARKGQHRWF